MSPSGVQLGHRTSCPAATSVQPDMVVVCHKLLLSPCDGVMMLQQGHCCLQAVGVRPVGAQPCKALQLAGSVEIAGAGSDPALAGWAACEVACREQPSHIKVT